MKNLQNLAKPATGIALSLAFGIPMAVSASTTVDADTKVVANSPQAENSLELAQQPLPPRTSPQPPVATTICRQVKQTPSGLPGLGIPVYRQATDIRGDQPAVGRYLPGNQVELINPLQELRIPDPNRNNREFVMLLAVDPNLGQVWAPVNVADRNGGTPVEAGALIMCNNSGTRVSALQNSNSPTPPNNTATSQNPPIRGRW